MPALPHPLTLEERLLAENRWRARRAAIGESAFLGAGYAALSLLALWAWWRLDARAFAAMAAWVEVQATSLTLAALVVTAWAIRQRLAMDARRHAHSSQAALPIWRETQRRRDTRVRSRFALALTLGAVAAWALIALHDAQGATRIAAALRFALLAAWLAVVFVPAPRPGPDRLHAASARLARVPRWIEWLAARDLPHLSQWWWQRAASAWMRGRAATALGAGLLLAPSEAAAVVVPLTLLALMALVNALDAAHRLAGEVLRLLAERPPGARRLWRNLWPLQLVLAAMAALLVLGVLHLLGAGVAVLLATAAAILLIAQIDFLLALVLRRRPERLPIVRLQTGLIAIAVAGAFAPLLLVGAVAGWIWLLRRVLREDGDA
jgi:hypothetical protein